MWTKGRPPVQAQVQLSSSGKCTRSDREVVYRAVRVSDVVCPIRVQGMARKQARGARPYLPRNRAPDLRIADGDGWEARAVRGAKVERVWVTRVRVSHSVGRVAKWKSVVCGRRNTGSPGRGRDKAIHSCARVTAVALLGYRQIHGVDRARDVGGRHSYAPEGAW